MKDSRHFTDGYDESLLPDFTYDFLPERDLQAFAAALSAPEQSPSSDDLVALAASGLTSRDSLDVRSSRRGSSSAGLGLRTASTGDGARSRESFFITAQNDWAPVTPTRGAGGGGGGGGGGGSSGGEGGFWGKGRRRNGDRDVGRESMKEGKRGKSRRKTQRRSRDETREGYLYTLLKWPFLAVVSAWIAGLGVSYLFTRLYIWLYEHFIAWRGKRLKLRKRLYETTNYVDWVKEARQLDTFLGNDLWKVDDEYAYYDHRTVKRVFEQIRRCRRKIENSSGGAGTEAKQRATEELKALIEACVKNNFVGVENSRLYSQTYYGTKNLVQEFVDEVERGVKILANADKLGVDEKRTLFKRLHTNFGRTALCLSGGGSFAYYHFGVVKALLDADLLPEVITGTSGGALVAALVATRTNDELKKLLVPALARRITACSEPFTTWVPRWWKTGARFDSVDWAKRCSWFTRGSMTFREAYERTGRILSVSCVPADPHSPTILTNYLTSPDCVIWSAVLASAAVPGILNPVVLMMKNRDGTLVPYSFGHKWKDGSLRTDIPLKALNLHFNVNFSIVSQVNPHINLFFFSSRGSVGQPVTHRRGRGWRGGFLGSATEQYLKLDLNKWLKVVRHLELLPRPLGQDWSEIWLQQFSGTITIWPRSIMSDFWRILSDPNPKQLARMLHVGQQSAFPKLKFLGNRMKVERTIERGRRETRVGIRRGSIESIMSEDDMKSLLRSAGGESGNATATEEDTDLDVHSTTGDEFEEAVIDDEKARLLDPPKS